MFKIAALCFLLVQLVYGTDRPHIIDDCLVPGEHAVVLFDQEISKDPVLLTIQEEIRRIPPTGFSPEPISCITVTNLDSDGNAGYPTIKAGGVGYKYVMIHTESQRGKGYDFQFTIYYNNSTAPAV